MYVHARMYVLVRHAAGTLAALPSDPNAHGLYPMRDRCAKEYLQPLDVLMPRSTP